MRQAAIVGAIGFMLLIAAGGVVVGYGIESSLGSPHGQTVTVTSTAAANSTSSTGAAAGSTQPYILTLVVTTNNTFNATIGQQPAYYVVGPHGPVSAATLALPAHRLIELVIIDYDDEGANLTGPQYAAVSGTQNNTISVVSNGNMNSTQAATGMQLIGGQNVTSLSADNVAHTFTIPQLGINIPLAPSSTTTAYITLNQAGTFAWFCMSECGSGPLGVSGAMETPGWMTGNVVAS